MKLKPMGNLVFSSILFKSPKCTHWQITPARGFPGNWGCWLGCLVCAQLAPRGVCTSGTEGLDLSGHSSTLVELCSTTGCPMTAGIASLGCWFSNQLRIQSPPVGQCLVLD